MAKETLRARTLLCSSYVFIVNFSVRFREKGTFLRVSLLTNVCSEKQGSLFKTPWFLGSDTPTSHVTTEQALTLSSENSIH